MRKIHIRQLASPCITRVRGEEASERLDSYIGADQIAIDFGGVEIVSLSFLDGLIARLVKAHREENVIFIINPDIEDRLARIAGIRSTTVYCCSDDGIVQKIAPKFYRPQDAVFVPDKVAARH